MGDDHISGEIPVTHLQVIPEQAGTKARNIGIFFLGIAVLLAVFVMLPSVLHSSSQADRVAIETACRSRSAQYLDAAQAQLLIDQAVAVVALARKQELEPLLEAVDADIRVVNAAQDARLTSVADCHANPDYNLINPLETKP